MDEILPGVWHWTARHPDIDQTVSSYYLEDAQAVLDPLLPAGGLGDRPVERVILSCRLHGRDTADIVQTTGATVHVPEAGLQHFADAPFDVTGYAPGDDLAPGVRAHEMAAISPDDMALHIGAGPGALHFADGLLVSDGELSLMPDSLMDDPPVVRRTSLRRLDALLALDFDALTFAHSDPIVEGGRARLAEFVAGLRP
ncbi:MAG: hypothetical protein QOF76_2252 [Solirubrobacteraceae bacterium]|nr:hypothetical protein [Solirubrobacteraceae bacterium]